MLPTNTWLNYGLLCFQFLAEHNITWKFIAPQAAWWERMVRTTKCCLHKVLGWSQFSEEGLNTILVATEAAINSRTIVQARDEPGALPLAHFLIGERLTALPTGAEPKTNRSLTKEFRMQQKLTDDLWKWQQREYLMALKSFHEVQQQQQASTRLRTGDVTLLQEDVRPRRMWKRTLIKQLTEGRDGMIHTVVIHKIILAKWSTRVFYAIRFFCIEIQKTNGWNVTSCVMAFDLDFRFVPKPALSLTSLL